MEGSKGMEAWKGLLSRVLVRNEKGCDGRPKDEG